MSILPDWRIRELARQGMIEPFQERLIRTSETSGVISYGLSSFGYDLRCAPEWKVFVNVFNTVVDPKAFDPKGFVDVEAEEIIIPPNSFILARSVEYLRIPDNVMVVALGKSTYARCFSEDTRVALLDGTQPTLKDMAERAQGGERFWGYSVGEHGRIVATLLDAPRLVGRDTLLEVTLDDGAKIHATPDHLFMTRGGQLVPAGELRAGQALMPLYRDLHRGYEMVYQPLSGFLYPTHRLADEWNVRHDIYPDQPGTHRHHLDFDRRNNNPWNLARVAAGEHLRLHNARSYGEDFDPAEHGAAIAESLARRARNEQWRANFSRQQKERASAFWSAPAYEAARATLLARRVARWSEGAEREAQARRVRAFWEAHPERRAEVGERSRAAWREATEERRERQRAIARAIKLRGDIDANAVRRALDQTGSIRGAAALLGCDRSVFRRFPEVLAAFRGQPQSSRQAYRNHKVAGVRPLRGAHDVYCLTVPEAGNFALAAGVFVGNCGIVANVTPLEPGWEGHVTLEFSNTTPLPAKMYGGEGCVQLLFFEGERPEVTYRDRAGKYQGQQGVTLPKL